MWFFSFKKNVGEHIFFPILTKGTSPPPPQWELLAENRIISMCLWHLKVICLSSIRPTYKVGSWFEKYFRIFSLVETGGVPPQYYIIWSAVCTLLWLWKSIFVENHEAHTLLGTVITHNMSRSLQCICWVHTLLGPVVLIWRGRREQWPPSSVLTYSTHTLIGTVISAYI